MLYLEHVDIFMLMYNLSEYNDHYSMTSGSLWDYFRDDVNDDPNENNSADNLEQTTIRQQDVIF